MHLGDAAAELRPVLHFGEHVGQEEHLAVARSGQKRVFWIAPVLDEKAWVFYPIFAPHAFQIALPALAVGRIREHEVELARGERVVGQGRVFRSSDDIVRSFPFPLKKEVGFADGVGFGVDLLPV